jgi:hypothetical protein
MKILRYITLFLILVIIIIKNDIESVFFIIFMWAILYLIIELYKLVAGEKYICNSKGINKYLFGQKDDVDDALFTTITLKTAKGFIKISVWFFFFLSISYISWYALTRFVL